MKKLYRSIFLTIIIGFIVPKITFAYMSELELFNKREIEQIKETKVIENLKNAKYYILVGNTEMAKLSLGDKIFNQSNTRLQQIKDRYLSLIYFIEGDYQSALRILNKKSFQKESILKKVCSQKTLLMIIMGLAQKEIERTWQKCRFLHAEKERSELKWQEQMVEINSKKGLKKLEEEIQQVSLERASVEKIKKFLKMALFIQREDLVLDKIFKLPAWALDDPEIREIIGLMFYRQAKFQESLEVIEGLSYTNAENIRGNIYQMQQKFELAYPQYKLVWKNKFSTNSASRHALPLAWKIKEWEDGLEIIKKIPEKDLSKEKFHLFNAIFYTALEKYEKASLELNKIPYHASLAKSYKVKALTAFNVFQNELPKANSFYSESSCDKQDLYACWIYEQQFIWENIFLSMKRKDPITKSPEQFFDKILTMEQQRDIVEEVLVDPRYIKELDRADRHLKD